MYELKRLLSRPRFLLVIFLFVMLLVVSYLRMGIGAGMEVAFLDVGQGDAVLITSPSGKTMLYDAGVRGGGILARLGEELPLWRRTIDVCVASHPDADHIGGFTEVLTRYKCNLWLDGHTMADTSDFRELEELIGSTTRMSLRDGSRIRLDDYVYAEVLWPSPVETSAWRTIETNARSISMRVRYASSSVFLSGDLPIKEENILVGRYGKSLKSDIFKAGHHGSRTSSSAELLAMVAPSITVISSGMKNRYGHPHREVIDRIRASKSEVYETAKSGTVHIVCVKKCSLDK